MKLFIAILLFSELVVNKEICWAEPTQQDPHDSIIPCQVKSFNCSDRLYVNISN